MVNSLRGRPAGSSDARDRLIQAARQRFFESGYAATSVRAIARDAGVDHTLVNYYFGSKQELFGTVMALSLTPSKVLSEVLCTRPGGPPTQLAERLLGAVLAVWERRGVRDPLIAMLRQGLDDDSIRVTVAEFLGHEVITQIADHIGGPDASRRAAAVGTVIAGLVFARYLLRVEPIASMPPPDLIRTLAPMVAVHLR